MSDFRALHLHQLVGRFDSWMRIFNYDYRLDATDFDRRHSVHFISNIV